jgi:hypothetical protein
MPSTQEEARQATLQLFKVRRTEDGAAIYLTKDQGLAVLQAHPDRQFLLIPEHISPNHLESFSPGDQCTLQSALYSYRREMPYTELNIEDFEILRRPESIPIK